MVRILDIFLNGVLLGFAFWGAYWLGYRRGYRAGAFSLTDYVLGHIQQLPRFLPRLRSSKQKQPGGPPC